MGAETRFCRYCGEQLAEGADPCPSCGEAQPPATAKNPWLAAILSAVFPGIGQLYAGRAVRGLAVLVGGFVLGYVLITLGRGPWIFLIPIAAVIDAYFLTKVVNEEATR